MKILIIILIVLGITIYCYYRPDNPYIDGVVAYNESNYQQTLKLLSTFADKGDVAVKDTVDEMKTAGFYAAEKIIKSINTIKNAGNQEALWMIQSISKRNFDDGGLKKIKMNQLIGNQPIMNGKRQLRGGEQCCNFLCRNRNHLFSVCRPVL